VNDHLKLVPEGVEGRVPDKGSVSGVIHQLVGGLKASMGYTGNETIEKLQNNTKSCRLPQPDSKSRMPHDVTITREFSEL